MNYSKLRKLDGICNICDTFQEQLSWDHIPPKGGIDLSDMWVQARSKSHLNDQDRMIVSQNGLKFRTLCRECNSLLSRYDLAFNKLMLDIKMIMQSSLVMPNPIRIKTYPIRVAKSILGHMLAANISSCHANHHKEIRKFLIDDNAKMPEGVKIFFWFYPYNSTVVKTDFYEINILDFSKRHYSILKSFPLAFAAVYDNSLIENTMQFKIDNNDTYNTEREILFSASIVNDWNFPEKIGEGRIHFAPIDNTDILATPKYPKI